MNRNILAAVVATATIFGVDHAHATECVLRAEYATLTIESVAIDGRAAPTDAYEQLSIEANPYDGKSIALRSPQGIAINAEPASR